MRSVFVVVASIWLAVAPAFGQQIYQPGNGVSSPIPIKQVKAKYPEAARAAKAEGIVLLSAVVREDGTVGEVKVTRSLGTRYAFDREAINAAKQWVSFTPPK
jgi:TonB family protein